jgi:hypothetical protein
VAGRGDGGGLGGWRRGGAHPKRSGCAITCVQDALLAETVEEMCTSLSREALKEVRAIGLTHASGGDSSYSASLLQAEVVADSERVEVDRRRETYLAASLADAVSEPAHFCCSFARRRPCCNT